MTQIEKLSLSEKLSICADKNKQLNFLKGVREIIYNGGLAEEDLEEIANIPIHGLSLRKIIQMNTREGMLVIEGGNILPNNLITGNEQLKKQ